MKFSRHIPFSHAWACVRCTDDGVGGLLADIIEGCPESALLHDDDVVIAVDDNSSVNEIDGGYGAQNRQDDHGDHHAETMIPNTCGLPMYRS